MSKIPFKKVTRYSLPNVNYQSNMVVAEIDGNKWFGIDRDLVVACAHLATGSNKTDQVLSMVELGKNATQENKAFIMIADWNIDLHAWCGVECEVYWPVCVDLIDAAPAANLREVFWTWTEQKLNYTYYNETNINSYNSSDTYTVTENDVNFK